MLTEIEHLAALLTTDHIGINVKAAFSQPCKQLPLRSSGDVRLVGDRIDERGKIALSGHMIILLAQTSGRRIARVRKRWLAFFCRLAIQLLEARLDI